MKRKWGVIALVLTLICGMGAVGVLSLLNVNAQGISVSTFEELQSAVSGDYDTIILSADIPITETLEIDDEKIVTTGGSYSLVRGSGFASNLISVSQSGNLTLQSQGTLTIDGGSEACQGSLINNKGSLHIKSGVELINNNSSLSGSAVNNSGSFTLDGGAIYNNSQTAESGRYGVIYSNDNSSLTIKSGEIHDNTTTTSGTIF